MELFSRGEDNPSTRRKTRKSNQKYRWSSLVVVKTIYLREGKLGLKNRLKTPVIILSFKDKCYVYKKLNCLLFLCLYFFIGIILFRFFTKIFRRILFFLSMGATCFMLHCFEYFQYLFNK